MSTIQIDLARIAATAPATDEDDDGPGISAAELAQQPDLHELALAWASWVHTRKLYVRPSLPPSVLGRLTSRSSGRLRASGGPDAAAGAELAAFHLAFLAQPEDQAKRAFELHYLVRVRSVKAASAALGISRPHWYRLVRECRQTIYTASRRILDRNLAELRELPSQRDQQN
ncbi:hypothetical protein [Rubrivivax sp. JA1026]|uniref:hypothetical protein n=1 Tax=Rubrivivax sp. JA1026 TaxID=2710888 RepID=UPI0013E94604|nr:hypothetical protein [Rubrivivax sp. JA1026]